MNNNLKLLDWITLLSFGISLYALYIALENLQENRELNIDLMEILDNLEWCDYSHNLKEAHRLGLNINKYKGKYGKEAQFSKPLLQYDLDGNFIKEWENAVQVKRELGYCAENIRNVCKGRRKQANGYKWKYKEE